MTKREAAIVAAYTGYLIGDFGDMHEYIEEVMGHPVFTHQMAGDNFRERVRSRTKADFVGIKVEEESNG